MIRSRWIAALGLAGLLTAGCGTGTHTANLPSPFVGEWAGTWSDTGRSDSGAMNFTVAADGTVVGDLEFLSVADTGDLTGTVGFDGRVSGAGDFAVDDITYNGTVTKDNDELVVLFNYTYRGTTYFGSARLTPLSGGGNGS